MREGLRKEGGSVDNLALKNIRVLFFLNKTLKVCPDACLASLYVAVSIRPANTYLCCMCEEKGQI